VVAVVASSVAVRWTSVVCWISLGRVGEVVGIGVLRARVVSKRERSIHTPWTLMPRMVCVFPWIASRVEVLADQVAGVQWV